MSIKKIKINERQAKMLKGLSEETNKRRVVKLTESQYKKLLENVKRIEEGMEVGETPTPRQPSYRIDKSFSDGYSNDVKKQINTLYEEFINELYGLSEGGENKYDKLKSLLEVSGFIQNGRIKKSKFGGNKERVKEVIGQGLYEMANGRTHYSVMEMIEGMVKENDNYPPGANNDSSAPYNQNQKVSDAKTSKNKIVKLIWFDGEDALLVNDNGKYIFNCENIDRELFEPYAEREEIDSYRDEEGDYYKEYSKDWELDGHMVEHFINDYYQDLSKGTGVDSFESGTNLVKIDSELGQYLVDYFKTSDTELVNFLTPMDETTTASSSGSFVAPLSVGQRFDTNVPEELGETTTTTSVGGSSGTFAYDAPVGDGKSFWLAGNKQNKKKINEVNESSEERYVVEMDFYVWANSDEAAKKISNNIAKTLDDKYDNRANITNIYKKPFGHIGTPKPVKEDAKKDTQYPEGGFVEFDDCTKLNNNKEAQNGGCSQGAVDNVVKVKKTKSSVVSK